MLPLLFCILIGIIYMMNKKDDPLMSRSKETNLSSGTLYGFLFWLFLVNPIIIIWTINGDKITLSMYLKEIHPISIKSDHDAIVFKFIDSSKKDMVLKIDELKGLVIVNDLDTFNGDTIINKSKIIKSYPSIHSGYVYIGSFGDRYYLEITNSDYKKLPPLYRKETGKIFKPNNQIETKEIKVYLKPN